MPTTKKNAAKPIVLDSDVEFNSTEQDTLNDILISIKHIESILMIGYNIPTDYFDGK